MSDIMVPVPFKKLLKWVLEEYKNEKTIFGIHEDKFYHKLDTLLVSSLSLESRTCANQGCNDIFLYFR